MNTMKNVLQFDQRHLQRAQHPSTTMRMQSGQGMVYGESTMTPYYRDDFATLYHGDCREVLPQLEPVALVLTDPPYGKVKGDFDEEWTNRTAMLKDAEEWQTGYDKSIYN